MASNDGSPFEAIKRTDELGDHWLGRELQPLMGYDQWRRFEDAVERACIALSNLGYDPAQHVCHQRQAVSGTVPGTTRNDVRLTRLGAYITAMNGDPRKPQVAAAQMYFALQTRRAETELNKPRHEIPQSFADALQLAADQQREIERKDAAIAELAPKAEQADHFRKADGLSAVGDFANDLALWARETHGVKILHAEVRDFLGQLGLLIRGETVRNNEPTADAIKRGLMRPKHTTIDTNSHGSFTKGSARFTPKGWGYAWDRAVKRIAEHGSLKPSKAVETR